MNHQVPMAIEKSLPEDGKILIKEIFYSIQGEGQHSGRPAIFIRLGGCNLQCGGAGWDCDTDYSNGDRLSIKAIVDQVIRLCNPDVRIDHPLVVITGGEPFRQFLLPDLCEELIKSRFQIQIETNGTCFQKEFSKLQMVTSGRYYSHGQSVSQRQVFVVCSPKAEHLHKELEPHISCLKLLVKNVHGTPYVCFHNSERPLMVALKQWQHFPIYLQPLESEDLQKNTDIVVEACMHYNLPISLQLHKILNLR